MFFTLLTTISAVHPTTTPIAVSLKENLTDLPLELEALGILASVFLGAVALFVSWNAYRFAKKQQKEEEAMRQREAKIAVLDKAFEIYNYFVYEAPNYISSIVMSFDEVRQQILKQSQIDYMAKMIFNDETHDRIHKLLNLIRRTKNLGTTSQISKPEQLKDTFERIYFDFNLSKHNVKSEQKDMGAIIICVVDSIIKEINDIYDEYRLKL